VTYYLLVTRSTREDVRRLQALIDSGKLDPETLVREGKAIRG
jgi:hypothetical protein